MAAEKNYITSWIKRWYEEYGYISGEKRAQKVEKSFNERLFILEKNIGKDKILECPNLASIIASTYQGAMSDLDENKVDLYVNYAINAIQNEHLNDAKKHIFLNMLRDFTLIHINILKEISKSKGPRVVMNSRGLYTENDLPSYLRKKFKDKELLEAVIKNLSKNHLIYATENEIGSIEPTVLTQLGKEFLDFITEQENKND